MTRLRTVSAMCLAVACGGDSAPPAAPVLQRVILSPASTSIVIRGAQQFTATGRMSDGSPVMVAVRFSATGGEITSSGLFKAGRVSGSYRVIAIDSDGTLADSSDVTLTPTQAHNYTTTFPATEGPISEGGRWITGGTVGLDWTDISTRPGRAIGHQVGGHYTDATAVLTGSWGPNQHVAAATFSADPRDECFQEVELRLRSAVSAHVNSGYEISYKVSHSSDAYLIVVRWNGGLGDFTYLLRRVGAQYGVKDGDVVSASIVGNVITAYKNGVVMARVADSTFTSGNPGMGFNLVNAPAGCHGTNGNYGFTSFTATDAVVP